MEKKEVRVIVSNIQYIEVDNINEAGEIKRCDEAMSGEFVLVEKKYKSLLKKKINQIMIEKTEEYCENFANGIKEDLTK